MRTPTLVPMYMPVPVSVLIVCLTGHFDNLTGVYHPALLSIGYRSLYQG